MGWVAEARGYGGCSCAALMNPRAILFALPVSTLLAIAACGGETADASKPSDSHAPPSERTGVTGPTDSPNDSDVEDGFVKVPCSVSETITDLSSVAAELGVDFLGYFSAADRNGVQTTSLGATAGCADEACVRYLSQAVDDALRAADEESKEKTAKPVDERTWSIGHLGGPEVRVVVARRGDAFEAVSTTAQLRKLLGPIDSPWKAHLFLLTTDARYSVQCLAYAGEGVAKQATYVKAGAPNQVRAVEIVNRCNPTSESRRVLLNVDANGLATVASSTTLWTGSMGCE